MRPAFVKVVDKGSGHVHTAIPNELKKKVHKIIALLEYFKKTVFFCLTFKKSYFFVIYLMKSLKRIRYWCLILLQKGDQCRQTSNLHLLYPKK